MHNYDLAKLASLTGELDSRKRVQKVVYLLQTAGCRLDADFYLHHYGPYSTDVARALDELARANLLEESKTQLGNGGRQYGYKLTDAGRKQITALEAKPSGQELRARWNGFEQLAVDLARQPAWPLEVASTIAYFYSQQGEWESAKSKAFSFKAVDPHNAVAEQAESLARSVIESAQRGSAPAS